MNMMTFTGVVAGTYADVISNVMKIVAGWGMLAAHFATRIRTAGVAVVALGLVMTTSAHAQCDAQWQAFDPATASIRGVVRHVSNSTTTVSAATVSDVDGPGAEAPKLILAGDFTIAGDIFAQRIVAHDLVTGQWSALGTGMNRPVAALATLANGDVVAGGNFTSAGGVAANRLARWSFATRRWSEMGTGPSGPVLALATLPDGDVVAGGLFVSMNGVVVNHVARWNSATEQWTALGVGMGGSFPVVRCLAALPNGDLIAGGSFSTAGGVATSNIALWRATSGQWAPLGAGLQGSVLGVAALSSGDVVAAGQLFIGGVAVNVARWNAATGQWTALGTGINGWVYSVVALANGDVFAGGNFGTAGGTAAAGIARWNSATGHWESLDGGVRHVNGVGLVATLVTLPDGDLIAGGEFTTAGGTDVRHVARFGAAMGSWSSLGQGMGGDVYALATLPGGDLVAGGNFKEVGSIDANFIARWNATSGQWSPLGTGLNGSVGALAALPQGDLFVGGSFTNAGGVAASAIARWNSDTEQWTALGAGLGNSASGPNVAAMTTLHGGDLIVGGTFTTAGSVAARNIARWHATSGEWTALGDGLDGTVLALATLPSGEVVAGGRFRNANGFAANAIARWNPDTGQWATLGSGFEGLQVSDLAVLPSGDLLVAGYFSAAGGVAVSNIARWSPASEQWSAVGPIGGSEFQSVYAVLALPNGDLVASGFYHTLSGITANRIMRWTASTERWAPIETGVEQIELSFAVSLVALPRGDIVAGGYFKTAGSVISPSIARLGCVITCDDIDFNNNAVFPEDQDVIDFFALLGGEACSVPNTCNDIDFNNNGVFPEDQDVIDFFNVLAGGSCP